MDCELVPHAAIEVSPHGLIATTRAPWLEIVFSRGVPLGCWVEIVYRASYLDHLVRPLIRFETVSGFEYEPMSAALFGRAAWIGRVPDETLRVLISPVDRPGAFGFEIEGVRRVSRLRLLTRAFRNDFKTAFMSLGARFINARQETRQALMFARGGIPMAEYAAWRSSRYRPFDPAGIDAPRRPADRTPHVRFIFDELVEPLTLQTPLLGSLLACGGDWSLCAPPGAWGADLASGGLEGRLVAPASTGDLTEGLCADDLVVRLDPSVSLPDFALPVIVETAARERAAVCFYGDEEARDADGLPSDPRLKPDWSPDFEAGLAYLGHPVFWRVQQVRRMQVKASAGFDTPEWRRLALEDATSTQTHHVRRVLATGAARLCKDLPPPAISGAVNGTGHAVSIVIPTKNQLTLLKTLLHGLRHETGYPILEILIVDNGSNPAVDAFYKTLAADPRITIIRMPGPFNFSAMCNAGARSARGECLVFLNNDMSICSLDWLGPLVAHAMRPDIGAVGARLLFPGGPIQHAGVVVGMGGHADHVSHGAPADDTGYLGRIGVVHEVGAVTGACIAVETRKFHEVNGFDAENLPVELNDIDLCLRLAAAGWATLMCPQSLLIHHQSASRGFSFRPFQRYGRERAYFRKTWPHMIRDDPFFHPALSLFSTKVALDG